MTGPDDMIPQPQLGEDFIGALELIAGVAIFVILLWWVG